jgi:hypothetical protein
LLDASEAAVATVWMGRELVGSRLANLLSAEYSD